MPSLQGVLASIPGIAGYEASRQSREQSDLGQLQQMGALQKIAAQQQAQQRQQDYERALAAAGTLQERVAVAERFSGAPGILSHADRLATVDATKENARNRLTQATQSAQLVHEDRMRNATTAEGRAREIARHNGVMEQIQREAVNLAGGRLIETQRHNLQNEAVAGARLFDETLITTPTGVPSGPTFRETAPTEADAFNRVRDLSRRGVLSTVGVSDQPAQQPVQAPVAPETGAAPAFPGYQGYIPPQNVDTELRRAPSPVQQPTAPQAPQQAGAIPNMPPQIAALPAKGQRAWLLQQTKPSIAGAGTLDPKTLEFTAKQYLAGDRQAVAGFARNATSRVALQNAIVDEAAKQGISPEETAARIADFAGTTAASRSVGQRAAAISLAATEAKEMMQIVRTTSEDFARTNFVPWNMALRAYTSQTGRPEIKAFGAAINALVNVYARAINPTGVPTVSDKEHARAIIESVNSPAQVEAVLKVMGQELDIAIKAPQHVQQSIRGRIPNIGGNQSQSGWSIRPK